ncbi:MAG TPA: tetratricopeptide repeat protein [Pyrinomonadaceae bacterium]|nr:tetratricopeptide repeat protein [Pyrinomonadaceae bacterium]
MSFKSPRRYLLLAAMALCLLPQGPARALEKEGWTKVQSKNFLLIGNAAEREMRDVAARLEQFRATFLRLLPVEHFDSSTPVTVMVFKTDESYRPFEPLYQGQPAGVAGFFQSNQDVDYITLSVDRKHVRSPFALAFHEYVHLLVRNSFRSAPLWFNEGLAEYYSTFEISSDKRRVTLGKAIDSRAQALRPGAFIPLEKLLSLDSSSEFYFEPAKRNLFYAESWALVHYLLSGTRRAGLSNYLELLGKGVSVEDAFRQAFQQGFEEIEGELRQYINSGKYSEQFVTFDRGLEFDAFVKSSALTEAEAQFYLGDLLLHTNRLDEAEAYLQKAVELDPGLATAHASLAVLRMRQNRFDDAMQQLKLASQSDSDNYLVHYYHAYVLSREGAGSDASADGYYNAEQAALMRAELRKAIELAPNFAEAYRLLAYINLVREEQLEESVVLLKRAIELSPRRQDFALLLAEVHMRREEFGVARSVLQSVIQSSASPRIRTQAQSLLASVAAREEYLARVRALEAEAHKEEQPPPGVIQPCDAPQPGPQLKKLRFEGQQVCGMLVQVECVEEGVLLFVESGGHTLKLHSDKLSRIRFVTYTADVKGQITCGLRSPANPVLITYRPTQGSNPGVDGEVIAVEFVPRDWNANH